MTDPIEGIYRKQGERTIINRRPEFEALVESEILNAPGSFAVLFVDLDQLKFINDTEGHDMGDRCIILALETMEDLLQKPDEGDDEPHYALGQGRVIHISGDEYMILLRHVSDDDQVALLIDRMQGVLSNENGIEVSMGGCVHRIGDSISDILEMADKRMYENKDKRRLAAHALNPQQYEELMLYTDKILALGFLSLEEAGKYASALRRADKYLDRLADQGA